MDPRSITSRLRQRRRSLSMALREARRADRVSISLESRAIQVRERQVAQQAFKLAEKYGADWPGLTGHELSVYSQNGEDGVIAEISARVGVKRGLFVEIGAHPAQANCLFLAHYAGWGGVFIDGGAREVAHLRLVFESNDKVQAIHEFVTPENINDLLSAALPEGVGRIDLLSIDVDGCDYWLWNALTVSRPKIVVIEYNSYLPFGSRLVQPPERAVWDGSDYFGASIGALTDLAHQKGYVLVHCDSSGVNAFYVRKDFAGLFAPESEVTLRGPNHYLAAMIAPPYEGEARYHVP